jgi:RHS repeat-associated protein
MRKIYIYLLGILISWVFFSPFVCAYDCYDVTDPDSFAAGGISVVSHSVGDYLIDPDGHIRKIIRVETAHDDYYGMKKESSVEENPEWDLEWGHTLTYYYDLGDSVWNDSRYFSAFVVYLDPSNYYDNNISQTCESLAHCENGEQDAGETGIDCGGECDACDKGQGPKKDLPAEGGNICGGSSIGADTGEYFHSQDLLSFHGPPLSASIQLSYRSFARAGTLGVGWRHSYDIALRDDGSGNTVVRIGSKERLYVNSGGVYSPEVDDHSTFVANGGGTYTLTEKSSLTYTFNSSGKCTTITDRNGNQNLLAYNEEDLLETLTDSAGRVLTFTYNTHNAINSDKTLASITDPIGNTYTFAQTDHLLTAVNHPDGGSWSYAYDSEGYLLSKTYPGGQTVTNILDANHRITQNTDPEGRSRTFAFPTDTTPTVLSTTFTEKNGNDWIYTYDTTTGVVLSKTDPEGFTTSYTWDSNKNMLSKTEPGNVVTSYTYDSLGNVLTVTDALNRVTTFTYNSFGRILTATGPRDTIENTYDAYGNLIQVKNFDDALTFYEYNSIGQVTKITDALNRETNFVYDANGLLTNRTPPSGVTQSFTYDANGNLLTMTEGGLTTTYTYDTMNRVATVTDQLNNVTTYTHNWNGNLYKITNARNYSTYFFHNHKGQVIYTKDPAQNNTYLEYGNDSCAGCGGVDQLTKVTDPEGKITTFEYSPAGHMVREIDPLGHITQYFYEDGRGNLTKRIDANNQTILYAYDKLNRLIQVTLPDSQTVSYIYDPVTGDLTNVTGPDIGYTFTYDTLGRTTGVIDTRGYSLAYTYNDLGQRTQVTLPGGQTIAYGYDTANRLSALTSELGLFTFGYDTLGRRSSLAPPNGVTAAYSYDNADRLTSLIHSTASGNVLNIAYPQIDPVGNRLQRSEDGEITTYKYTQINSLNRAENTQGVETFTHDGVGNRRYGPTKKENIEHLYEHNDAHQMTFGRKFSYTYDNNGNQIIRTQKNGKGWIQEWDALNRMVKLERTTGADSRTVTFKYDPFGRRIEKKVVDVFSGVTATTTTAYVYDNEDIVLQIETIEANGATTTTESRFIHGPGIDEPLAMVRGGQNYFYHADGLGSIVAITDQNQTIVQKYSYEAFGLPTPQDPSYRQPYTFTAREWDRETGLFFYRTRYYDPMEGRFISKDTIGFGGGDVNLYRYVENNPINIIDPNGLRAFTPTAALERALASGNITEAETVVMAMGLTISTTTLSNLALQQSEDGGEVIEGPWPGSNAEPWPDGEDWRGQCIRLFNLCVNENWDGNCGACLNKCTAQHEWPFEDCPASGECR